MRAPRPQPLPVSLYITPYPGTNISNNRKKEKMVDITVGALNTLLLFALPRRWRSSSLLTPSPLLFLLLQLVVAAIFYFSTRPRCRKLAGEEDSSPEGTYPSSVEWKIGRRDEEKDKHEDEEAENDGDHGVEELNKRAEAFISAFRQHLLLDSASSHPSRQ